MHGIKRRTSLFNTDRIDHVYQDPHIAKNGFQLHYGDLSDTSNLNRIMRDIEPDEVYNLAAQSHVAVSFETPEYTADIDALGTLRLLEFIRFLGLKVKLNFIRHQLQNYMGLFKKHLKTHTPFYPRSML